MPSLIRAKQLASDISGLVAEYGANYFLELNETGNFASIAFVTQVSGVLYDQIIASTVGVASLNGLSGAITIVGSGGTQVITNGGTINIGYTGGISSQGNKINSTSEGGLYGLPSAIDGAPRFEILETAPGHEFTRIVVFDSQNPSGARNAVSIQTRADLTAIIAYNETDPDPPSQDRIPFWIQSNPLRLNYNGGGGSSGPIELWGDISFPLNDSTITSVGNATFNTIDSINKTLTGNWLTNTAPTESGHIVNKGYLDSRIWRSKVNIITGSRLQAISFDVPFASDPFVFTQIEAGNNTSGDWTSVLVSGITTTGFWAVYGQSYTQTGYRLHVRAEI